MKSIITSIEELQLNLNRQITESFNEAAKKAADEIIKDEDFREGVKAKLVSTMMEIFTVGRVTVSEDRLEKEHLVHFTIKLPR